MPFDLPLLNRCWFLAGPTASGKTALSLELARRLDAEIVSLDSMALYRGMDIGTAKPSAEARKAVPHHLLDVIDPHEEFSVADYVAAAEAACRAIVERGRVPLFVGGTGLYLRGLLRGVFEGPAADPDLRRNWEDLARREGEIVLHGRLEKVDPVLAARLHPNDVRRVIRGLEVFELTGIPLSVQQQQLPLPPDGRPRTVFWLHPPRDWLYRRIDARVEQMFAEGLVAEVERLLATGRAIGPTARQALGYKEVIEHLDDGIPLATTLALVQGRTRRFAKRQHTWFRHLEECRGVEIAGDESPEALAATLITLAASRA